MSEELKQQIFDYIRNRQRDPNHVPLYLRVSHVFNISALEAAKMVNEYANQMRAVYYLSRILGWKV